MPIELGKIIVEVCERKSGRMSGGAPVFTVSSEIKDNGIDKSGSGILQIAFCGADSVAVAKSNLKIGKRFSFTLTPEGFNEDAA